MNTNSLSNYFVGREDILKGLVNAVTKPVVQDVFLESMPGFGKTSLMLQLQKHFTLPFIPIYIPLKDCGATTSQQLSYILNTIENTLFKHGLLAEDQIESFIDFESSLKNIIAIVSKQVLNMRLILLFDDYEYLITGFNTLNRQNKLERQEKSFASRIINAIRSSELGASLGLIITGNSYLINVDSDPDLHSFIINGILKSCYFEILEPLTADAIKTAITDSAAFLHLTINKELILKISSLSGGIPLYYKTLCFYSFESAQLNNKIDVDLNDVETATQITLDRLRDHYYIGYWKYLTHEEKIFLLTLANSKRTSKLSKQSHRKLQRLQLIKNDHKNQFLFTADLFKFWTQQMI